MLSLIFAAFICVILMLLKVITATRYKIIREYWEGTNVLKSESKTCYNRDTKTWVLEGQTLFYNINGSIQKDLQYINNRLDGVQKHYDESGKLLEMVIYENGTMISRIKQD